MDSKQNGSLIGSRIVSFSTMGSHLFSNIEKIQMYFQKLFGPIVIKNSNSKIYYITNMTSTFSLGCTAKAICKSSVPHLCINLLVKCWKPLRFEFQLPHSQLSTTLNTDQKLSSSQQVMIFWQLHAWRGIKTT